MAIVKLEPRYEEYSNRAVSFCRSRGVDLTDYAEGLLRLAVEAQFEEPPKFRNGPLSRTEMESLILRILERSIEDPHVNATRAAHKKVAFNSWLLALAVSGRGVLKDLIDKGF